MRIKHFIAALTLACGFSISARAEIITLYVYSGFGYPYHTNNDTMHYDLRGSAHQETIGPGSMTLAIGYTVQCWSNAPPFKVETSKYSSYQGQITDFSGNDVSLQLMRSFQIPWDSSTPQGTCWWCNQNYKGIVTERITSLAPGYNGFSILFPGDPVTLSEHDVRSLQVCRPAAPGDPCPQ